MSKLSPCESYALNSKGWTSIKRDGAFALENSRWWEIETIITKSKSLADDGDLQKLYSWWQVRHVQQPHSYDIDIVKYTDKDISMTEEMLKDIRKEWYSRKQWSKKREKRHKKNIMKSVKKEYHTASWIMNKVDKNKYIKKSIDTDWKMSDLHIAASWRLAARIAETEVQMLRKIWEAKEMVNINLVNQQVAVQKAEYLAMLDDMEQKILWWGLFDVYKKLDSWSLARIQDNWKMITLFNEMWLEFFDEANYKNIMWFSNIFQWGSHNVKNKKSLYDQLSIMYGNKHNIFTAYWSWILKHKIPLALANATRRISMRVPWNIIQVVSWVVWYNFDKIEKMYTSSWSKQAWDWARNLFRDNGVISVTMTNDRLRIFQELWINEYEVEVLLEALPTNIPKWIWMNKIKDIIMTWFEKIPWEAWVAIRNKLLLLNRMPWWWNDIAEILADEFIQMTWLSHAIRSRYGSIDTFMSNFLLSDNATQQAALVKIGREKELYEKSVRWFFRNTALWVGNSKAMSTINSVVNFRWAWWVATTMNFFRNLTDVPARQVSNIYKVMNGKMTMKEYNKLLWEDLIDSWFLSAISHIIQIIRFDAKVDRLREQSEWAWTAEWKWPLKQWQWFGARLLDKIDDYSSFSRIWQWFFSSGILRLIMWASKNSSNFSSWKYQDIVDPTTWDVIVSAQDQVTYDMGREVGRELLNQFRIIKNSTRFIQMVNWWMSFEEAFQAESLSLMFAQFRNKNLVDSRWLSEYNFSGIDGILGMMFNFKDPKAEVKFEAFNNKNKLETAVKKDTLWWVFVTALFQNNNFGKVFRIINNFERQYTTKELEEAVEGIPDIEIVKMLDKWDFKWIYDTLEWQDKKNMINITDRIFSITWVREWEKNYYQKRDDINKDETTDSEKLLTTVVMEEAVKRDVDYFDVVADRLKDMWYSETFTRSWKVDMKQVLDYLSGVSAVNWDWSTEYEKEVAWLMYALWFDKNEPYTWAIVLRELYSSIKEELKNGKMVYNNKTWDFEWLSDVLERFPEFKAKKPKEKKNGTRIITKQWKLIHKTNWLADNASEWNVAVNKNETTMMFTEALQEKLGKFLKVTDMPAYMALVNTASYIWWDKEHRDLFVSYDNKGNVNKYTPNDKWVMSSAPWFMNKELELLAKNSIMARYKLEKWDIDWAVATTENWIGNVMVNMKVAWREVTEEDAKKWRVLSVALMTQAIKEMESAEIDDYTKRWSIATIIDNNVWVLQALEENYDTLDPTLQMMTEYSKAYLYGKAEDLQLMWEKMIEEKMWEYTKKVNEESVDDDKIPFKWIKKWKIPKIKKTEWLKRTKRAQNAVISTRFTTLKLPNVAKLQDRPWIKQREARFMSNLFKPPKWWIAATSSKFDTGAKKPRTKKWTIKYRYRPKKSRKSKSKGITVIKN